MNAWGSAKPSCHGKTVWRPKSGHILFGGKKFFAWLPAVPEGSVTATITTDGATVTQKGNGNIGLPLKLALKLAGLDPTYTRVIGTVTLERFEDDAIVEQIQAPGLWEQMYFGTNQDV